MGKMKSCPFCGGEVKSANISYNNKNGYIPVCRCCSAMIKPLIPFNTEEESISAWNERNLRSKLVD